MGGQTVPMSFWNRPLQSCTLTRAPAAARPASSSGFHSARVSLSPDGN